MTEIKNFIPTYPDPDDPNLISKVAHLREFTDLRSKPTENIPEFPGIPLSHQELEARYFAEHTLSVEGVLWHGVGVGKSCTASLIVERFKKTLVDGRPRKRALIIVKNTHLRESFRNEIAKVCTRDIYIPRLKEEELKKLLGKGKIVELTEEAKRRRLNTAIAQTYEIVTAGEILSKKNIPSAAVIERDYSNRLIIVDEVHNLRVQPIKRERTLYDALHYFLHTVKNCRILLLTATPIWDKVYDIASLMNLLLPLNDQLPVLDKFTREFFDKDGELKPNKAQELKEKMRGKISYLRSSISNTVRTEIGVKEPWLKWIAVYPSMMSDFQTTFAEEAKESLGSDIEKKSDAFLSNARDAVNCVFPIVDKSGHVEGGAYGTDAFKKYAIETRKRWVVRKKGKGDAPGVREQVSYDYYRLHPNIVKLFGPTKGPDPYANLRKYAAKFATIIEMLKDPKRLNEKAFIFGDSVKGTGGVISLALTMELYGFHWIKTPDAIPRKPSPITVEKPGSFVVTTSDDQTISESAQIRRTLEEYNKIDNIYGNRIRIIIGSQTIAQGHTMKATRQGHVLMPHWNLPEIDQAMGRIYRVGSFDQLPEKERYVNFYRHVSIMKGDTSGDPSEYIKLPPGVSNPSGGVFSTEKTVDTHIYGIAENKEHLNSQIYRIMKESSWDCALTYERNVLASDVDGTRDCDFVKCNYQCDNYPNVSRTTGPKFFKQGQGNVWSYRVPPEEVDSSNYNLLYSAERVKYYIEEIRLLFRSYFTLRFDMLLRLLGDQAEREKPIVLNALHAIINHRLLIRNRYGFGSYLKEDRNTYFLDNNVSAYASYPSSIYTIFPFVTERSSLEDTVEVIQLREDREKVVDFAKDPKVEKFANLSYRTQILLLEKVVELRNSDKPKNEKEKTIVRDVWKVLGREVYEMSDGNFIHNMYNSRYTGTGYNVFTKDLKANGRMRVFDRESETWSYVMPNIENEYIEEVKEQVAGRLKRGLEDNPYKMYGIAEKGRAFKIMDDRFGKVKTGQVCRTMQVSHLWGIFHHLEHLPYDDEVPSAVKAKSKRDLIEIIRNDASEWKKAPYVDQLDNMSTEDVRKVYVMLTMPKNALCVSLERWFKGDNPDGRILFEQL